MSKNKWAKMQLCAMNPKGGVSQSLSSSATNGFHPVIATTVAAQRTSMKTCKPCRYKNRRKWTQH